MVKVIFHLASQPGNKCLQDLSARYDPSQCELRPHGPISTLVGARLVKLISQCAGDDGSRNALGRIDDLFDSWNAKCHIHTGLICKKLRAALTSKSQASTTPAK